MDRETKEAIQFITMIFLIIIVLCAAAQGLGFISFSILSPRTVAIQTQVFHESQAYTDGMVNDLADLRIKYMMEKDADAKDAIRALVIQRFKGYDKEKLTPELKDFYEGLERGTY